MRNYKNMPIPPAIKKAADEYIGHPYEVDEGVSVSLRRDAFAHGMMAQNEKIAAYIRECLEPEENFVKDWENAGYKETDNTRYTRGKVQGYKDILRDIENGGLDNYMASIKDEPKDKQEGMQKPKRPHTSYFYIGRKSAKPTVVFEGVRPCWPIRALQALVGIHWIIGQIQTNKK